MTDVRDLMTPAPFTASRQDDVGSTRDAMLDSGIHCLPVTDPAGHPVGIITSWDLVEEYAPQESIENAMTSKVIAIGVDDSISEAAILMRTNFVHHLVVVDAANEVVGILSSLDLLEELVEA